MEASYEGGQGPEGAVAPYMEWKGFVDEDASLTSCNNCKIYLKFKIFKKICAFYFEFQNHVFK